MQLVAIHCWLVATYTFGAMVDRITAWVVAKGVEEAATLLQQIGISNELFREIRLAVLGNVVVRWGPTHAE